MKIFIIHILFIIIFVFLDKSIVIYKTYLILVIFFINYYNCYLILNIIDFALNRFRKKHYFKSDCI